MEAGSDRASPTAANGSQVEFLRDLGRLIANVQEPFLVPDVTHAGEPYWRVFHALRDMVDAGTLTHGKDGYRRV